jgi:hypothetical protein
MALELGDRRCEQPRRPHRPFDGGAGAGDQSRGNKFKRRLAAADQFEILAGAPG